MASALDSTPRLEVTPLSGSLGAEIRGIDLAEAGPADADAILALIARAPGAVLPGPAPDARRAHRLRAPVRQARGATRTWRSDAERPEFFELRAESGAGAVADEWHSDLTCQAEPSRVLDPAHEEVSRRGRRHACGPTCTRPTRSSRRRCKDLCEGLSALHDASPHDHPERRAIHPVVRVHPETGRKSLFVNEHFTRRIVELSDDESDVLLRYLTRRTRRRDRFTVRYRWSEGTIAMWDNRCTQHHVLNDFEGERVIQRVTVMGDRPEPAAPPR